MKNLNTILISILILAVGVLYFLHFKNATSKANKSEIIETGTQTNLTDASVAYIDIDTLLTRMEMFKDLQAELAGKQKELESNFKIKYNAFERNVTDLQNKVNKGLVTRAEAEQMNQQLANDQLQLENLNADYTQQLQEEGIVSNRKVIDYIMEYLKDYTQDKNIKYVFSFAFGGNLLYMDPSFNITEDVLNGVNAKYLAEKENRSK